MNKILIISQPASGKTTATKKLNRNIAIRTDRPALDLDLRGKNLETTRVFRDSMTNLINEAFNQGATFVFTHCGYVQPKLLQDDIEVYYVVQTNDKLQEAINDAFVRDAKNGYNDKPYFALDYKKNKYVWRNNQIIECIYCKYLHDNTKILMLPLHTYISDLIDFGHKDLNNFAYALMADILSDGITVDACINAMHDDFAEQYLDKIHRVTIQKDLERLLGYQYYSGFDISPFTCTAMKAYIKTKSLVKYMKPLSKTEVDKLRKEIGSEISGCEDDSVSPLKDR